GERAQFDISWDGKTWENVSNDLDSFIPSVGTARYSYQLRCRLTGEARLQSLRIINDLQMAPLSLPEMGIGDNPFNYSHEAPGELNPDREYYWHVRAKDAQGVWGEWSKMWRFTPRGPAPPLNVSLSFDAEKNLGILRWSPNSLGRQPVAYRIYASDEKGFSI